MMSPTRTVVDSALPIGSRSSGWVVKPAETDWSCGWAPCGAEQPAIANPSDAATALPNRTNARLVNTLRI